MAATGAIDCRAGTRSKIGLNAYSFNTPLRDGSMTLDDMIELCAAENVDAVDATGYYFPATPNRVGESRFDAVLPTDCSVRVLSSPSSVCRGQALLWRT